MRLYLILSNKRRSTKANHTAHPRGVSAYETGKRLFAIFINKQHDHRCSCQHRQRQELTEHTLVHLSIILRHVPAAVMMHAGSTCRICGLGGLVNMERRQNNHWQERCQQYPRCNISLHPQIHACKGTNKREKNQIYLSFFRAEALLTKC